MALIKSSVVRTSQPADLCGLDRANQLYKYLSRVLVPRGIKYYDLISGQTFNNASDATFTVSVTQAGVGRRTNSTTLNSVTQITQLSETISNVAYVWSGVVHTPGGTTYPFVRNNQFSVSVSSASNPVYSCRAGSTTNRTGTTPVVLKKQTTFGWGKSGSTYTLIVDGKVELSGTDTGTAALTTWAIDSNAGFAQSNDITTNLVLIFKTGDADILKAAVDNPWQVFEPEEVALWIPDVLSSSTNYTLPGTAGSYTVTGNTSTFKVDRLLSGLSGSYAVTGNAAALAHTPGASSHAYTLAGSSGSYSLTGNGASFDVNHALSGASGSYAVTGMASIFKVGHSLIGEAGSYSVTGNAATLEYVGSTAYTLSGDNGVYGLTGGNANFNYVNNSTPVKHGGDDIPQGYRGRFQVQLKDKIHLFDTDQEAQLFMMSLSKKAKKAAKTSSYPLKVMEKKTEKKTANVVEFDDEQDIEDILMMI